MWNILIQQHVVILPFCQSVHPLCTAPTDAGLDLDLDSAGSLQNPDLVLVKSFLCGFGDELQAVFMLTGESPLPLQFFT